MGTVIYTGGAANVADVINITPGGTIEVGDIFKVTIGISTVQIAASATTVASVCTDLLAALSDGDAPAEFQELTWSVDSTVTPTYVIGTGPSDGRPIYASLSVATTEAGGGAADAQTIAKSNPTPATGQLNWNDTDNWDTGAVPVNNDTVHLGVYGIVPVYNINKSSVTGISLYVHSTDVGGLMIGLPKQNPNGYVEYLGTELELGVSGLYYGIGAATNVPKLRLDTGTYNYMTAYIFRSDARGGDGKAPLYITGTNVNNVIIDCRGVVDFCNEPGDTGSCGTISVGNGGDIETGTDYAIDTSLTMNGGTAVIGSTSTIATVTLKQGTSVLFIGISGPVTTLTQEIGSSVDFRRNATVTNYTSSGSIDFSGSNYSGITFTNVDLYSGASWNDPRGIVTTTNGIDLNQCGIEDVSITTGKNQKIERTAL